MKTILTYVRNTFASALAITMALVLPTACEQEEFAVEGGNNALSINLSLADEEPAFTRTEEAATPRERAINKLDIYVFKKSDGTLMKHYKLGSTITGAKTVVDPYWTRSGYELNTEYEVYVFANGPEALASQDFADVTAMKQYLVTENRDFIVNPSSFLMDGYTTWKPQNKSDQLLDNVVIKRSLAKLQLKAGIGTGLINKMHDDHYVLMRPLYKASSMAMRTTLTADGITNYDPNLLISGFTNPLVVSPDLNPNATEAFVDPSNAPEYIIEAYSYRFSWTAAEYVEKTPKMLLSFEFRDDSDTTIPETDRPRSYHYYMVPLVSSATTGIESNYLYKANVIINSYGSTEEVVENEEVNIKYEVVPWDTSSQTDAGASANISTTHLTFLSVSPENPAIYEGDEGVMKYITLTYSASDDVQLVDISSYYRNNMNVETPFPNKSAITNSPNPNGTDAHYSVTLDKNNHTIKVGSMIPINKTVKYIKFTVKMGSMTEEVTVRHFPEDFVLNIPGLWSTKGTERTRGSVIYSSIKDDPSVPEGYTYTTEISTSANRPNGDGWTVVYNATKAYSNSGNGAINDNWRQETSRNQPSEYPGNGWQTRNGNPRYFRWYRWERYAYSYKYVDYNNTDWVMWDIKNGTNQDSNFRAKYYAGGNYRPIHHLTSRNSHQAYDAGSSLNNNHMYVIQTGATSNNYVIGKPILDSNYQSQDNVVSPAFMMASQLGAVSAFSGNNAARDAATHCHTYMEVAVDGHRYTDWRLPTKREIAFITQYQYNTNASDVIVEVLSGYQYYTLSGELQIANSNDTQRSAGVRCVRDLTPDDIRYLNGEMTGAEETAYNNNY